MLGQPFLESQALVTSHFPNQRKSLMSGGLVSRHLKRIICVPKLIVTRRPRAHCAIGQPKDHRHIMPQ